MNSNFFSKMFQPYNQGLRVERISKKTRGRQSHDTVPLSIPWSVILVTGISSKHVGGNGSFRYHPQVFDTLLISPKYGFSI